MRSVTVTLYRVDRLANSTNGNPRYRLNVTTDASGIMSWEQYVTQLDSACAYDVGNIAQHITPGHGVRVVLGLTRGGRVSMIERAS